MANYGRAGFDVETFSTVNLKKSGAWNYTKDPQAELLCFAPSIDGKCLPLWLPGDPLPMEWFAAVYGSQHFAVAYNWFFEYSVFNNIMVQQLDLHTVCKQFGVESPYLPVNKFDCAMARARTFGLPSQLLQVTQALGIDFSKEKDYILVTKPKRPTQKDPALRYLPDTNPEGFQKLYDQCVNDEWGEVSVDVNMPAWNAHEQTVFAMDQRINARGVPIDVDLAHACIEIIAQLQDKYWEQIEVITEGAVEKHTETPKIKAWMDAQGYDCIKVRNPKGKMVPSLNAESIDTMLEDPQLPEDVRQVLTIRQTMGLESIKKYYRFIAIADPDTHRLYDQFSFYGAQATGRWAARGAQLHNFARGNIKVPKGVDYDEFIGTIIRHVKMRNLKFLEMIYPNPVAILSSLLRPSITAPEGMELCVSDYSSIEARVIFWLIGAEWVLDIFRQGQCVYCVVAADVYGVTYEEIYDGYKSGCPVNSLRRQLGKQACLGLNYQMGGKTFVSTLNRYLIVWDAATDDWDTVGTGQVKAHREAQAAEYIAEIDPETGLWTTQEGHRDEAEKQAGAAVVKTYRTKFKELPKFWKDLEKSAIAAVQNPGQTFPVGQHLSFSMTSCGRWLQCHFPSGRPLMWFSPEIRMKRVVWCEDDDNPEYRMALSFLKLIKNKYMREFTYGGDLAESVTQGVARDLLANGMASAEANGYAVIMHVHDEIVALQPKGTSDLNHFNAVICQLPAWAHGLPLNADGWVGKHYRKD